MNFTTPIFIFVFFPIAVSVYLIVDFLERRRSLSPIFLKFRVKDFILIAFGMLFYMWACFDDIIKLGFYMLGVWSAGCWISRNRNRYIQIYERNEDEDRVYRKISLSVFILIAAVLLILFCLVHFKYMPLWAEIWNYLFRGRLVKDSVMAPIGISFITFSAISYLTDIYRGDAPGGTLIDCVLYLSFFPKVISGPIILWKDFSTKLDNRTVTLERFVSGLNRIMIGFAKKLILADQFGSCISNVAAGETDMITGWGMAFLYMLEIYYDFSGYSDIAIGLAGLLGFEFEENFHFPYRSKSISEFWRRWHISLGRWFREYIYIPLGGSRRGERKAIRNVAVVFALTGIWHGAGWNYILWGGINGGMVILERVIRNKKFYQKQPEILKWFVTMGITFFCWQFFRFSDFGELWDWLKLMFGKLQVDTVYWSWRYYFDKEIITLAVIGAVGSVAFGGENLWGWYRRFSNCKVGFVIQEAVLLIIFVLAILFMINSTYSPFIYFQY